MSTKEGIFMLLIVL